MMGHVMHSDDIPSDSCVMFKIFLIISTTGRLYFPRSLRPQSTAYMLSKRVKTKFRGGGMKFCYGNNNIIIIIIMAEMADILHGLDTSNEGGVYGM